MTLDLWFSLSKEFNTSGSRPGLKKLSQVTWSLVAVKRRLFHDNVIFLVEGIPKFLVSKSGSTSGFRRLFQVTRRFVADGTRLSCCHNLLLK